MNYTHIDSSKVVIEHIVTTLAAHLRSDERIVWLLAGGSAIPLEAAASQAFKNYDTSRLSIFLADERYGPLGHADENYTQLMHAGFALPLTRTLTGASAEATTKAFGETIEQAFDTADFSFGVFGIGADGHTTGIKPHSPAVTSTKPAAIYESSDGYQRLTITPGIVRRLDEAVIYAVGSEKADTLRKLLREDITLDEQPAQVLKEIKTATLYTDNLL